MLTKSLSNFSIKKHLWQVNTVDVFFFFFFFSLQINDWIYSQRPQSYHQSTTFSICSSQLSWAVQNSLLTDASLWRNVHDSRLFKFGKARIDRSLLMSEVDFFPASINSLDFGLHHSLSNSVSPFLCLSLCFVHPYPAHVPLGSECIKFSSAWPMSDMHSHKDSGTNFVIYTLPMLINFFMFSTSDEREKKMGNFPYRCLSVTALRREAIL